MVLKRKRSDSEISRSSSIHSSPLNMMSVDFLQSSDHQIRTPSLFSSRTRKRHRDNRPSEEDVHQHTLSLLFSAQQNPQSHFQPAFSIAKDAPVASVPRSNIVNQQSSLHSFWVLPNARPTSPLNLSFESSHTTPTPISIPSFFSQPTNCEDCDASLTFEDGAAMDVDVTMDLDNSVNSYGCSRCGKPVCSRCAVSNLGVGRKCLGCAGRDKKWDGGLKWMDQD